jgi:protease I
MICHAGWVGISAGIVNGKRLTSTTAIRDDLVNAGAEWIDEEVVQDGNLITSRSPKDLPAFCKKIIETMREPFLA